MSQVRPQLSVNSSIIFKIKEERDKRLSFISNQTANDKVRFNFLLQYQSIKQLSSDNDDHKKVSKNQSKLTPFAKNITVENDKKNSCEISNFKTINLGFVIAHVNSKKRSKQQFQEKMQDNYEEILLASKQKYLQKIERQNRKRHQRCKNLSMFGLNIKTLVQDNQKDKILDCKMKQSTYSKQPQEEITTSSIQYSQQTKKKEQSPFSQARIRKLNYSRQKSKSFIQYNNRRQENSILRPVITNQIILQSFGCYYDKGKNDNFKYFVGKGNNKQLILSLLKKRQWWSMTDDINSANLIWTQTKHNATIQRQANFIQDGWKFDQKHYEDKSLEFSGQHEKKISRNNIFHPKFNKKLQNPISQRQKLLILTKMTSPQCLHNHFSQNYMFGNKNALFQNLTAYFEYKNENVYQIIPLTFFIEDISSQKFQQFERKSRYIKHAVWIVKPGENSNRGNGIFISKNAEEIKKQLSKRTNKHTYIIQKYISNLFLYRKRKFDIRTYLLMLTINGITKFFWYKDGYIRTSSHVFDLKDISNSFIHLTNDAIQINSQTYGKFENGNKVTYHEFQRYLDYNYSTKGYKMEQLNTQMKKIAKTAVNATYNKLDPHKKCNGFELFGLDFIVDAAFKPWLIEINTNPCLELTSPTLSRLIPRMLQNLFRIAVDPIFQETEASRQKNHTAYENSLDRNKFQLIFDSLFDRDREWQQFSEKINLKVYDDGNEIFQGHDQQVNGLF